MDKTEKNQLPRIKPIAYFQAWQWSWTKSGKEHLHIVAKFSFKSIFSQQNQHNQREKLWELIK